jgi:hypothetical protein
MFTVQQRQTRDNDKKKQFHIACLVSYLSDYHYFEFIHNLTETEAELELGTVR